MKNITPKDMKGSKVYVTEADRDAQKRFRITSQVLEQKIKLLSLLHDHVVIAASHIFESPATYQVILKNRGLLENGIIVPALRDSCRDFRDFLDQKQAENSSVAYRGRKGSDASIFLQSSSHIVALWRLNVTQQNFKDSLLSHLHSPNSLITKDIALDEKKHALLLERLSNVENLSRENVNKITQDFPDKVRVLLSQYINLNYYIAGANAVESDLVLGDMVDIVRLEDKIENIKVESKVLHSNIDLFKELLLGLDIPIDILNKVVDKDIIELRKDSAVRRFRKKYSSIIDNIRQSLPENSDSAYELKNLLSETKQTMRRYVREEIKKELADEKRANKTVKTIQVSGYATAIASLLSLPVLPPTLQIVAGAAGAIGTGLQLADPLLQKVLVQPNRGEFIVFAAKLLEASRKYT